MHQCIRDVVRPGVTTGRLDGVARDVLERRGATSNFLGYHGYPAVICTSPNDVIVHGFTLFGVELDDRGETRAMVRRYVDWAGVFAQLGLTLNWRTPV